jgi:hypothetical protein
MSRRVHMRIVGVAVLLGSLGIGSAAMAVSKPSGPPGKTGVYTPCPKTGYTSRPCSTHK